MSDEQADDTSIPFVPDKFLREFMEGKLSHPGHTVFPDHLQLVAAEMNRRLVRQQAKFLAAQNVLLKSQDKVAKSLKRATWVLSFATLLLALVTFLPSLSKTAVPVNAQPSSSVMPAFAGTPEPPHPSPLGRAVTQPRPG